MEYQSLACLLVGLLILAVCEWVGILSSDEPAEEELEQPEQEG